MSQKPEKDTRVSLLDKNADIDPVGVVYNVTTSAVEEFVYKYLVDMKNIDGVAAVRANVIRTGNQKPEVALYVFLRSDSQDVSSNMNGIPEHIKNKMDEGSYRLTDKLRSVLFSLTKDPKVGYNPRERVLYVKCNIFKALGIMFAADPRVHTITIPEVVKSKKTGVITVIKTNKFVDREEGSSFDKYTNIVEYLED